MPRACSPGTVVEVTATATSYTVDDSEEISPAVKEGKRLKVYFLHKTNTAAKHCTIESIIC